MDTITSARRYIPRPPHQPPKSRSGNELTSLLHKRASSASFSLNCTSVRSNSTSARTRFRSAVSKSGSTGDSKSSGRSSSFSGEMGNGKDWGKKSERIRDEVPVSLTGCGGVAGPAAASQHLRALHVTASVGVRTWAYVATTADSPLAQFSRPSLTRSDSPVIIRVSSSCTFLSNSSIISVA